MRSSDRHIVAARKTDPEPMRGPDTLPAPPPSGPKSVDAPDEHDTIPTPPPEPGSAEVVVVPPHLGVRLDEEGA